MQRYSGRLTGKEGINMSEAPNYTQIPNVFLFIGGKIES